MKRFLLPLVLFTPACGSVVVEAAPTEVCQPEQEWQLDFPGEAGPLIHTSLRHGDAYVAAGASFEGASQRTGVVSVDVSGALRWQTTLEPRYSEITRFADGYAIAGVTYENAGIAGPDVEVIRLSPEGKPAWTSRVGTEDEDYVTTLVPDGDALFVVGSTSPYASDADVLVSRLDAQGAVLWSKVFGKPTTGWKDSNDERTIGASVDAEGRLVVAAQRWINGSGGPPWVFAVDAQGDIAWEYLEPVTYDRGTEWVFLPMRAGGFLLSGYVYGQNSYQPGPARVVRLDAQGQPAWITSLDDGSDRQALTSAGVELADGSVVLAGYSANSTRARVWKLDDQGNIVWMRDLDPEVGFFHRARAMPDGGLAFLAGETEYETHTGTYQILRTDADGEVAWMHTTSEHGLVFTGDLDVSADGRILFGGRFSFEDAKHGRMLRLAESCRPR